MTPRARPGAVGRGALALVAVTLAGCAPDAPPSSAAPDIDLDAASARVEEWVDSGRVAGAVLSVWHDGRPLLEQAYGAAQAYRYGTGQYPTEPEMTGSEPSGAGSTDGERPIRPWGGIEPLERPVPMTVETIFDLASVTKVMATTMAVALLVDRGALDLEAPVRTYLPDFVGEGREEITLEQLLTHRSGLPQWKPTYYHAADADAAYAWLCTVPLEWPVGEERHYSDLGFMLLGRIVERVSGSPLGEFLEADLYGPLGLTATGFRGSVAGRPPLATEPYAATSHGNPFEYRMVHDLDFGYRIDGDPDAWAGWRTYTLVGEVNDGNAHYAFGGVAGHAGLFSTAGELQKLLRVLLAGGTVEGHRYLSPDVVARFLRPVVEGQALGWQIPDFAPAGSFYHTGFTGTFVLGMPEDGLGIVLLTNRQNNGVDQDTGYPDLGALQRSVTRALTLGG